MPPTDPDTTSAAARGFALDGRIAIVTGASSGLGAETARALAGMGARVAVVARRIDRLEALASEIDGHAVACDLADDEQVAGLVPAVVDGWGRPEILVNAAGALLADHRAEDEPLAHIDATLQLNLVAPFRIAQAAFPHMAEAGGGTIVNVSSISGLVGVPGIPQASYAASKAGLSGLTAELAVQWARYRIRVNTVAPGFFRSEITAELYDSERGSAWLQRNTPLPDAADAGDIVGAIQWLASDAARYVTGQTITVDGGVDGAMTDAKTDDLETFRDGVRAWCAAHVPSDWREAQTGVGDDAYVTFQKAWFQELRSAGYAVPHWPQEWGGGLTTAEQVVLYQELARHDAPRLVLAFVSIHHAASTFLHAGTDEQRARHLPAILDGEIWCQGFSEPEAGSDLAALKATAAPVEGGYVCNGQKVWASGAAHADWCLLLARTDPDAPKRKGISYLLMDMRSEGLDVRPIRQATGESHFCEVFLDDVFIPAENLIGAENDGWRVAQATLGAERGMTMLELAERLGHAGFPWLVELCRTPGPTGERPIDDPTVLDRLAAFETEVTGLRSLCRHHVERVDRDEAGPADASIVKLYYSEVLQRMTDFGAEVSGLSGQRVLEKPISSGWESGAWVLDFISSWEWTIPGGSSEIQRSIIGERGLGLPREPQTAP